MLLTPTNGAGLNPLLRHIGMIIHPPMLYLGFVAFIIPFAFGFASLVTGRTDDRWIRVTRRWTLIAWLFLSLGLILGMRWAYDVLGWGGYWSWDPVELAALIRGCRARLSAFGDNPGKARPVQALEPDPGDPDLLPGDLRHVPDPFGRVFVGARLLGELHWPAVLWLYWVTFMICLGLLLYRWNDLRSEGEMTSLLSREALFLVNNLLFMGILVVCFWG